MRYNHTSHISPIPYPKFLTPQQFHKVFRLEKRTVQSNIFALTLKTLTVHNSAREAHKKKSKKKHTLQKERSIWTKFMERNPKERRYREVNRKRKMMWRRRRFRERKNEEKKEEGEKKNKKEKKRSEKQSDIKISIYFPRT
jgi:hypothetical protein